MLLVRLGPIISIEKPESQYIVELGGVKVATPWFMTTGVAEACKVVSIL
jgi:hypothetical protein